MEDYDDRPYDLGQEHKICPACDQMMPAGDEACPACGYDRNAPQAEVKSLAMHWDAGLPLVWRIRLYVIAQGLAVVSLVAALLVGEFGKALVSWLLYSGLLAILLGTFDCLDLKRNQRGRLTMTRTWRIAFVPLAPIKLRLSEYDSVAAGVDRGADMFDWLLLLPLLSMGCLPGLIWAYLALFRNRYFVALSKSHGAPDYYLYRGFNEKHTRDMAETIREVAYPG